jgi:hypothetical protein
MQLMLQPVMAILVHPCWEFFSVQFCFLFCKSLHGKKINPVVENGRGFADCMGNLILV